ncbi:hypothetical protein KP509_03G019700 [Ceratopteris richardii]|uniref:RRM domain-containing protein n=1 Tax=Ceratopteris richardii TaxID=49495 RepID=A0A8T2V1I8_CERRI|nr:hypothetical protein KP509_03G019700 [Ceratopteris richardii]
MLKKGFEENEPVKDVKVIMDKATRKNKGYGFVTSKHKLSTAKAVKKERSMKVGGSTSASRLTCKREADAKAPTNSAPLLQKKIKKQKNENGLVGAAEQEVKVKAFETFACPIESHKVIEIEIAESEPAVGMKKWLSEYHNQRPGLHVLQQRIDEFIADFEAREERARQERETAAAEEGWTVVTRHKGRKKTTDSESGITVGGIAPAAVENKQKKKTTETALNFYRFQRREARRNEILELQQRFEEDKKKIVALRAARKFRPY